MKTFPMSSCGSTENRDLVKVHSDFSFFSDWLQVLVFVLKCVWSWNDYPNTHQEIAQDEDRFRLLRKITNLVMAILSMLYVSSENGGFTGFKMPSAWRETAPNRIDKQRYNRVEPWFAGLTIRLLRKQLHKAIQAPETGHRQKPMPYCADK